MAYADRFLVFRVQGGGVAAVDADRHRGVGGFLADESHRFTVGSPSRLDPLDGHGLLGIPAGELRELEGDVRRHVSAREIVPGGAVITDQALQLLAVSDGLGDGLGIALSLIPDDAFDPVRPDRIDHGVEDVGRILVSQNRWLGDAGWLERPVLVFHRFPGRYLGPVIGQILVELLERLVRTHTLPIKLTFVAIVHVHLLLV